MSIDASILQWIQDTVANTFLDRLVPWITSLGTVVYVLALLIALSRLYLCVHYPTDILGGIVVGVLCAIAIYYLFHRRNRKCNIQ